MTESNTSNSVRDRINAIVDAREKREVANVPVVEKVEKIAGPQEIEGPKKEKKNRLPIILGSVFGVVVVGLVVAIVVVVLKPWEDKTTEENSINIVSVLESYDGDMSDSAIALIFAQDVFNKMYDDDNYNYENAILDYQKACDESGGLLKIYLMIEYASFVYDEIDDEDEAIRILEQVENLPDNEVVLNVYYSKLRKLYEIKGDYSKVQYYCELLANLAGEPKEIPMNAIIDPIWEENNE